MSDPTTPTPQPSAAGMYDYYLGGTAHSPVDRAAAEQVTKFIPEVVDGVWANRGFLQRAVKRMVTEWGIRQFIDIGSGLPTQYNTHDAVADATADGRVVYVDHDPAVVQHARELLTGRPNIAVLEADLRDPEVILDHPDTQRLIDFSQPVGLLLIAVIHFLPDEADPWGLTRRYLDRFASGSYLALSHGSGDHFSKERLAVLRQTYDSTPHPPRDRTKVEVERFFDGLEIVPPYEGAESTVTFAGLWGAEDVEAADTEGSRGFYAAVARKP